jgi:AraC family transcriptional regulator
MAPPDDPDPGPTIAHGTTEPLPAPRPGPTLPAARVRRVTQYIEANLERPLSLVELSSVVRMSPYHFSRLFARSTGVPPHRFVVVRRMEAARALLTTSTTPIAVIARSVGFRTPTHFATMFRSLFGVTPTAYRRIHGHTAGAEEQQPTDECGGRSVA